MTQGVYYFSLSFCHTMMLPHHVYAWVHVWTHAYAGVYPWIHAYTWDHTWKHMFKHISCFCHECSLALGDAYCKPQCTLRVQHVWMTFPGSSVTHFPSTPHEHSNAAPYFQVQQSLSFPVFLLAWPLTVPVVPSIVSSLWTLCAPVPHEHGWRDVRRRLWTHTKCKALITSMFLPVFGLLILR